MFGALERLRHRGDVGGREASAEAVEERHDAVASGREPGQRLLLLGERGLLLLQRGLAAGADVLGGGDQRILRRHLAGEPIVEDRDLLDRGLAIARDGLTVGDAILELLEGLRPEQGGEGVAARHGSRRGDERLDRGGVQLVLRGHELDLRCRRRAARARSGAP